MKRLKELKYFSLILLLSGFLATASLSSCRETKKEDTKEQQGEQMMEEGEIHEEHQAGDADEHPNKDGDEHPKSEEHPKDSVPE